MTVNEPPEPTSYLRELATLIGIMLVLGALVFMTGCDDRRVPVGIPNSDRLALDGTRLSVIRIAGCEYIQWQYDRSSGLTHKGSCDNPIHCSCDTLR